MDAAPKVEVLDSDSDAEDAASWLQELRKKLSESCLKEPTQQKAL